MISEQKQVKNSLWKVHNWLTVVPVFIVDEFSDALDQYSRSGGLRIDRLPVTYLAAPHFLIILPIDIDVASEEIRHTNKLNSNTPDYIYLHMLITELPRIE